MQLSLNSGGRDKVTNWKIISTVFDMCIVISFISTPNFLCGFELSSSCLVAKSCLTLLWPHRLYPTRLLYPGISQARILACWFTPWMLGQAIGNFGLVFTFCLYRASRSTRGKRASSSHSWLYIQPCMCALHSTFLGVCQGFTEPLVGIAVPIFSFSVFWSVSCLCQL